MLHEPGKFSSLWLGLEPYSDADAFRFFGRSAETTDLAQRVERRTSTVFFAESGTGKTSLLRAGVFPVLRKKGFHALYLRLDHGETAPALLDQVWLHLERENLTLENMRGKSLWEWCHDQKAGLLAERTRGARVVFVFDQFEEIFTIGAKYPQRKAEVELFMEQLADLVENRSPLSFQKRLDEDESFPWEQFDLEADAYRVVISLREDYLSLLDREKERMPSVMQNRMMLDRLKGQAALEVVEGPDPSVLAPGMGEKIVRYVAGDENDSLDSLDVEPALLSLVCRSLDLSREGKSISEELLKVERDRILEAFYEECFEDIPAKVRDFVEQELVTEGGHRQSLVSFGVEGKIGKKPLELLIDRRLLHTEQHGQTPKVELTHDVLVPVVIRSREAARSRVAELEAKETEARAHERLAAEASKRRQLAWGLVASLLIAGAAITFGLVALHYREEAVRNELGLKETNHLVEQANEQVQDQNKELTKRNTEVEQLNLALKKAVEKAEDATGQAQTAKRTAESAQKTTESYLHHFLERAAVLVSDAGIGTSGLGPRTRVELLMRARGMYESLEALLGEITEPQLQTQIRKQLFEIDLGIADATKANLQHEQAMRILEKTSEFLPAFSAETRNGAMLRLEELKGDVVWDDASTDHSASSTAKDRGEAEWRALGEQARKKFTHAASIYETVLPLTTEDPISTIRVRNKLANAQRRLDNWSKSQELLSTSLSEAETLAASLSPEGEKSVSRKAILADTLNKLGNLYLDRPTSQRKAQLARAETAYLKAVELRNEILKEQPANPIFRYEVAMSLANLGDVLAQQEKSEKKTNELFRRRVEMARELHEQNPENLFFRRFYTDGLRILAIKLNTAGDKEEYLKKARQAVMVDRFQTPLYLRTYSDALEKNQQMAEAKSTNDLIRQLETAAAKADPRREP